MSPFFQVTSDSTKGNNLNLSWEKFRLHIRKKFITKRIVKHWNMFLREVTELPFLEEVKRHLDVVLKNSLYLDLIVVGLQLDLILRLFSNLDDSMVCSFIQRIHAETVWDFKTQKLMLHSQREREAP